MKNISIILVSMAMPWTVMAEDAKNKKQDLLKLTNDFTRPEKFEKYPQGTLGRNLKNNRNQLNHASRGLPTGGGMDFNIGRAMFKKLWAPAPAATRASNGLGPLFNARACLSCHAKNGRGHAPEVGYPNEDANSMLIRLSIPPQNDEQKALLKSGRVASIDEPTYGGQLQDIGVSGFLGEAKISVDWHTHIETLDDGTEVELRRPEFKLHNIAYGDMHKDVMMSPRIANQMNGMGLINAISDQDLLANEDVEDKDGDGISGKAQWVWDIEANKLAIGRFGWKGDMPNLKQQVAAAFSGDIGINSSLFPKPSGDCTENQPSCLTAPNGNLASMDDLEISDDLLEMTTTFNAHIAQRNRKNAGDKEVLLGKEYFYKSGCTSCHQPKFVTSLNGDKGATTPNKDPLLANELIWPYSDFLLHDMGEGLADNRPLGKATGQEWRTAPLWGLGASKKVNNKFGLMHDGRARTVAEAILWHGGEATAAKENYKKLSEEKRKALTKFILSL